MSSNNTENGGPEPTESQGMSAEQPLELLASLKSLPFDALSKLPVEVREAILAGRKTVDAEREQLNAERERLNAEREQLSADRAAYADELVKHNSEVMPQLKAIMAAAHQAHEREAGQNIFMAEMSETLVRLESASSASKGEQAKAHMAVIDRLDTMAEAAALSHNDQMRLSMSISNRMDEGFSAMAAQNNQLQVSVDRIGEMMNRLHDFIVNVRDGLFAFQSEFLRFKKTFGEFNISFRKEVRERFDSLPEKFGLKIQDIRKVIADLNGAAKGLVERSNRFAEQQEDHISAVSDRIDDLGSLYTNHTRKLNSGLEDQLKLAKSTLENGVDGLLNDLSEVFKKSEVHGLLSQIFKMKEELNHSQAGLTTLLRAIQDEKESMAEEIQEAKDAFKANARDINEAMSSVMDDKRRILSALSDSMLAVKSLMDDIERMRADVVKVAGSVEKISNVSIGAAIKIARELNEEQEKSGAERHAELLEAINTNGELNSAKLISAFLGDNKEGV